MEVLKQNHIYFRPGSSADKKKQCRKDHYSNESAQTLIEISQSINLCFNTAQSFWFPTFVDVIDCAAPVYCAPCKCSPPFTLPQKASIRTLKGSK